MHHEIPTRNDSAIVHLTDRLPKIIATVDLDDLNSPHTMAVLSVPPGASVLDIGCGPGIVANALAARGCQVWGVEIDPRRAASARHSCVEVLEGDIESVVLSAAFGGRSFDAILCLDVLEHLRDPVATLLNATGVLAPGGMLLISVPNVTHGALRLELLSGRFRYRESGLLDRGHLRFFDAVGVAELIRQAGLHAVTTLRVMRRLDQTEFDIDVTTIPDSLRATLENDVDALTYQFFVIASPARTTQTVRGDTLLERQRARIDQLAKEIERGAAYARHLEAELGLKDARVRELERTFEHAERELDARATQLTEREQVLADLTRLSDDNVAYVRHLEHELQQRAGAIAIRDDEMSVLRVCLETAHRTLAERDAHLQLANATLAERDAQLQCASATLAEREAGLQAAAQTAAGQRELVAHLSWVLRQPRHRLAEVCATSLKDRMSLLHRLLRPFVLAALRHSSRPEWR